MPGFLRGFEQLAQCLSRFFTQLMRAAHAAQAYTDQVVGHKVACQHIVLIHQGEVTVFVFQQICRQNIGPFWLRDLTGSHKQLRQRKQRDQKKKFNPRGVMHGVKGLRM